MQIFNAGFLQLISSDEAALVIEFVETVKPVPAESHAKHAQLVI